MSAHAQETLVKNTSVLPPEQEQEVAIQGNGFYSDSQYGLDKIGSGVSISKPQHLNGDINGRAHLVPASKFQFGNIPLYAKYSPLIQPKLSINTPGDQYEQEADAVADKIMRMHEDDNNGIKSSPVTILHRKCAVCSHEIEGKDNHDSNMPVQRKCTKCEEEEKNGIQRKELGIKTPIATDLVTQTLQSTGQSLDKRTRSFMEQRFGFDFSAVKIHDDAKAHRSARDINALAYTHKNNIVFEAGQYQPHTPSGKRLLAHELTHVVQQRDNGNNTIRRTGTPIVKGCKPTRRTGKLAFQGNTEHLVIAQFHQMFGHPNAESEYAIPESGSKGGLGFADIIDRSENVIFEIKSATSAATAPYELLKYIEKYTEHCDPDTILNLGTDYTPIIQNIPTGLLQTSLLAPGIIVYTVTPITPPPVRVPKPVPVPKTVLDKITDDIKDVVKDIGPVVVAAAATKVLLEKVLGEAFKKLIPFLGMAAAAAALLAILAGAKPSFAFDGSIVDSLKAMASDADGEEGGTSDKDTGTESAEGTGESEGEGKEEGQEKGDGQGKVEGEGKGEGDAGTDKPDSAGEDVGKTPDGEKDSDHSALKGTGKGSKESGDGKTADDGITKASGTGKGKGISKQTKDKLDRLPSNLKKLWGGLVASTKEGAEITDGDAELFLKYIEKFNGDISDEALADLIKKLRTGNQPMSEKLKSLDSSSPPGDQTGADQNSSDSKTTGSKDQEKDAGSKVAGGETGAGKSDGETEEESDGETGEGAESKTETSEGSSGTTGDEAGKEEGDKASGDGGGSGGGEKDFKDTTEEPPALNDYTKVKVTDERREGGSLISFDNIKFKYDFKEDIRGKETGQQIAMRLRLIKGSKVLFEGDVLAIITEKIPIYTEEPKTDTDVMPTKYQLIMTMIEPKAIRFTNKKNEKDFIDLIYLSYSYDV